MLPDHGTLASYGSATAGQGNFAESADFEAQQLFNEISGVVEYEIAHGLGREVARRIKPSAD